MTDPRLIVCGVVEVPVKQLQGIPCLTVLASKSGVEAIVGFVEETGCLSLLDVWVTDEVYGVPGLDIIWCWLSEVTDGR